MLTTRQRREIAARARLTRLQRQAETRALIYASGACKIIYDRERRKGEIPPNLLHYLETVE